MHKDKLNIIMLVCLIVCCLCFAIHWITDIEINRPKKCEHECATQINIPLTSALHALRGSWTPIYATRCVKCGGW